MQLVMQGQSMVSVTPIISDTFVTIYDQRVNSELSEAGRNRQASLPAANYKNIWFSVPVASSSNTVI